MLTKIGQKLLEMIPGLFFCAMFFGSYLLGFSSGVNKMQEEVVQLKLDHAEAKNTAVNAHVKLHQEIRVWAPKSAPP